MPAVPSTTTHGKTVALVGNPNTGKTSLFNALTGFRQHVGNYPGVTVEKKTGPLPIDGSSTSIELVDLPGAYSLAANSAEEAVVLDVLLGRAAQAQPPDVIAIVADATNLQRNLFLTSQLLELGRPVVVALNMIDLAEREGIHIDVDTLSKDLGVPVIPVAATKNRGVQTLRQAILSALDAGATDHCAAFPDCVCVEIDGLTQSVDATLGDRDGRPCRIELMQALLDAGGHHECRLVEHCGLHVAKELVKRRERINASGETTAEVEGRVRYAWIDRVIRRAVSRKNANQRSRTDAVDRILTHRLVGLLILLIMMATCFQALYTWASPLMDGIEGAFGWLGSWLTTQMPVGALQSLVVDGAIAGVGGVLVFLPQILILFLFLAILEDCGYLARAAFLLDRWMAVIGLNGKSFIPILSSFACAVPGIMAARTIEDRRSRFLTILIAPLMSCSARLPVYVLFIGAFVPKVSLLGGLFGLQAIVLLAMYLVGALVALPVALIAKRFVLRGTPPPFLMELPSYKWPSVKTVLFRMYEQGKAFTVNAGTIIFAVALVVWALGYYPHPASIANAHDALRAKAAVAHVQHVDDIGELYGVMAEGGNRIRTDAMMFVLDAMDDLESTFDEQVIRDELIHDSEEWASARGAVDAQIATLVAQAGTHGRAAFDLRQAENELAAELREINHAEAGAYVRNSVLARMGAWIEPIVKPLGWDWRIGTAVIASFPAREVIIATMSTIYNLGQDQDENSVGLRSKLLSATWPDGRPVFDLPVALSIMVFFALCCQCGATLATMKRQTNSWRWPFWTFTYMTGLAYVAAFVTYQVARVFA